MTVVRAASSQLSSMATDMRARASSLKSQATTMLACDFFAVDTELLKQLYVLFFIELDTRRVFIIGITEHPTGARVVQQARNPAYELSEGTQCVEFLIRERDTKFTAAFDEVFHTEGIRLICTPVRAPRANTFTERFVGTVCRECTDRMLIVNRRHLETVLCEYVEHYNSHRLNRSLSQLAPVPRQTVLEMPKDVRHSALRWSDRLGGLIHEYRLVA